MFLLYKNPVFWGTQRHGIRNSSCIKILLYNPRTIVGCMLCVCYISWLFGILLIHSLGFSVFFELWMQIKVIPVVVLTFYHFTLGRYLNDFSLDNNQKTSKFFRIYNEIPTLILIVVIFVVIFKPL